MKSVRAAYSAALVLVVSATIVVDTSGPAEAVSGSDWDPGFIVSDQQFYDSASMTASQIQSFLEVQLSQTSAGRCEPEKSYGPDDPIVCLKDYRMTTTDIAPDAYCPGGYKGAANELASTIIAKAAAGCGVSPKVILITLQKEMELVNHTWPSDWRYQKATGYACPDTGPCNPAYAGFQKQIYYGVRQFQIYRVKPTSYNHLAGVVNYVRYHPSSSCGGTNVLIRNQATAGLYNYTPYQPNAVALSNVYGGQNDGCSSYGNRNFWSLWWTWFGNPHATGALTNVTTSERISGANRYATAAALTKTFAPGAAVVYVASGQDYPDALAVAPIAASANAPLVLVRHDAIPPETAAELKRLAPTRIVVLGGTGAVNTATYKALTAYAEPGGITRLGGLDRYETARLAVRDHWDAGSASVVYIASGRDFPDALSAAAAAGTQGAPVISVDGTATSVDADTTALITELGATTIVIAGGTGAVSKGIQTALAAIPGVTEVRRLGGSDRYATSAAINTDAFPTASRVYLAYGGDYPDALTGAVRASIGGSPLYIVRGDCVPASIADDVARFGPVEATLLGGTGVLPMSVSTAALCR
ncbi:cell wall-binding repeat-containing protein [Demequina sp.]|uniref:cell wall-binding repeat-containing protein n=1 Tax=Demequina sp. TaxID=2050685 RepID=UPI0025C337B2|nr:cell wall-binding repeat-containing protein [Demequina sp.]